MDLRGSLVFADLNNNGTWDGNGGGDFGIGFSAGAGAGTFVIADLDDANGADIVKYFDDLGDSLSITKRDYLESRADVFWNSNYGNSRLRLQSFRTLDDDIAARNRPYKQLPQLTHRYRRYGNLVDLDFNGELVSFERDDSDTATRLRLVPAITREFETPGWFLRPRLALDHTSYRIDRTTSSGPEDIDRTLPVLSLDSGLVFERFGSGDTYQTLEPRAFYVYIPEEDQDDIPVFDSGRYGFSFAQLFRPRRFTGGDRIGDTRSVSLGLTSRLLDRASGRQVARASLGAIAFLEDRRVTLPSGSPEEPSRSVPQPPSAMCTMRYSLKRSSAIVVPPGLPARAPTRRDRRAAEHRRAHDCNAARPRAGLVALRRMSPARYRRDRRDRRPVRRDTPR